MRPESCKNCCAREFIEQHDAYVCAYCDTRYPKPVPVVQQPPVYGAAPDYGAAPVCRPAAIPVQMGKRKDKWVSFFLCLFLGFYGVHKFYEGRIGMGILYLFTAGLCGIGWIVDCIVLLSKPNPYYV